MGGISAIVPVVKAVGGLVSAFGGLGGGKKDSSPAPPAPLPQEATKEPDGSLDADLVRQRDLKRRKDAALQGGLLNLKAEEDEALQKKLLSL